MDTVFTFISIVVIGVGVVGWITENFGSKSKSRSRRSGGTKTYTWGFKLRDDYSPIPGFNAESVRADCCDLYRRMLAVELTAEIRAWNENDAGKVVSGSKSAVKEMRYAWVLRRPKTETSQIQHCPNCGCEVEINAGAFCPMCGAPLTAPGAGWQLSAIQAMSQKTL